MRCLFAILLALAACRPCDFEAESVCFAFHEPRPDLDRERLRLYFGTVVRNAKAHWKDNHIEGWTVVLHDHAPRCYGHRQGGCVEPWPFNEVQLRGDDWCPGLNLTHETGHVAAGAPFYDIDHSDPRFDEEDETRMAECNLWKWMVDTNFPPPPPTGPVYDTTPPEEEEP